MKKKSRRMPPHIVLPNGMWRFVKRGGKTTLKGKNKIYRRKSINMARRGRRYSRARRYYTRARGGRRGGKGNGVMKNVIDGLIVGVAQTALPDVIPMQDALICTGVGWFRRNPTLTTLGGVQLGAQLGAMVGGGLKLGGGGVSQV